MKKHVNKAIGQSRTVNRISNIRPRNHIVSKEASTPLTIRNNRAINNTVDLLKRSKKIIVLTGAGVSVSCGIPDFRSLGGLYEILKKEFPTLPQPTSMFDLEYFKEDPHTFFRFAREIYPGQFHPSPTHRFIALLEKKGKLLRNYTQNIDTLEHAAGIENVITCHGSFATASCTVCGLKVDSSVIKEDVFNRTVPYCPVCPAKAKGVMKPDIVFFGEDLPDAYDECVEIDTNSCDLLIVIGSSLAVDPVCQIPRSIPKTVPKILINRVSLSRFKGTFDIELLGDCDTVITGLFSRLKPEWNLEDSDLLCPPQKENIIPPPEQSPTPAPTSFVPVAKHALNRISKKKFTGSKENRPPRMMTTRSMIGASKNGVITRAKAKTLRGAKK